MCSQINFVMKDKKGLLEKIGLSMFGADKKLSKWNESDERARFR